MRRRAATVLLAMSLVCTATGIATQPAIAATRMTWGLYSATSTPYTTPNGNEGCQIHVWFWVWEHGNSGIHRLRAKTELRSATDALNAPLVGVYASRDWQRSGYFPDDATSYYHYFSATYNVFAGGTYKVRAKMVGDVASWWRRDVVIKADIATDLGCESGSIVSP